MEVEGEGTGGEKEQRQQQSDSDGEGADGSEPSAPRFAGIPDSLTEHRACKRCGLIKTFTQFYDAGCENCPFFEMEEINEKVLSCTSSFYAGFHAILDPKESWMAKWMQTRQALPGIYASEIMGSLPEEARALCEEKGYKWRAKGE